MIEIWGGEIEDFPKPHKRRFPAKGLRREVRVCIMVFYGIGHHFHADLIEEHNPLWDEKEQVWRRPWRDTEGNGRVFSNRFGTEATMKKWVQQTVKKHFPRVTHKVVSDATHKSRRWFYREGD